MNFPLSTAFTVPHRFWVVVFSFSFISMHILISFFISSVIFWLFSSVLFSLYMFEFLIIFLLSDQIRSVAQSCPTLSDPMNCSPPGSCKRSAKGKVHSNTGLPQETRKSQINNLILHLKQLEQKEIKNPRVSRRKENLKIRAEINAKETKETMAKINKAKSWFF